MKAFLPMGVAATVFLAGCGNDNSNKPAQGTNTTANYNSGNPVTAPVDYIGAVADAKKSSEKKIDVAYLNQAIQLFNVQEGRYPKDLQELVPNYVGKIPNAPFGYKIDYDADSGTVKVAPQ